MKNEATIHIHYKKMVCSAGKVVFVYEYKTVYSLLRSLKYLQIDLCCTCFLYEMWDILLSDVKSWLSLSSLWAETEMGILVWVLCWGEHSGKGEPGSRMWQGKEVRKGAVLAGDLPQPDPPGLSEPFVPQSWSHLEAGGWLFILHVSQLLAVGCSVVGVWRCHLQEVTRGWLKGTL